MALLSRSISWIIYFTLHPTPFICRIELSVATPSLHAN
ncbi:hypothetical protein FM109_09160 [Vibrio casei]|nr:hypothetical protein FM109_09160 [Vibrio casei]